MSDLRIWAPEASEVAARIGGALRPLAPGEGGWWRTADGPADGEDYSLFLDGAGPFPDPRSPRQPEGVHGPSRHVDHSRFPWTDAGFRPRPLASGVVYELHVGTFSPEGTFDGVAGRLDHLVELGVTHVELMPVAAFPGRRGWGYDGVALYAPGEAYGGPEGLKRLVDAAHARGLAVLLDVVYNHLGPDGNYLPRFGPYFTDTYATPWGRAMNFDGAGSDEVRRFCIDNARMWLADYHFDGLRLDAVHAIHDRSAIPFLEELAREVRALCAALGRELVLVAESDLNDPRLVRPVEAGGLGLGAQWNDDFHHALHALLTGERTGYYADFGSVADVATALTRGFVYDGRRSRYRGRRHGRPLGDVPSHRLLGYLQTHDQVGNRATGDRISDRLDPGGVAIGAALVLTSPFVPMLFMGEEWAASTPFLYFTDHTDPALGDAVREGRRREFAEFGWDPREIPDPQAESTFARSRLDWAERETAGHARTLDWYRSLIRLRRTTPALREGSFAGTKVRYDEAAEWLVVARGPIRVAVNFAHRPRELPAPEAGPAELVLGSDAAIRVAGGAVALPPRSVAILAVPPDPADAA